MKRSFKSEDMCGRAKADGNLMSLPAPMGRQPGDLDWIKVYKEQGHPDQATIAALGQG